MRGLLRSGEAWSGLVSLAKNDALKDLLKFSSDHFFDLPLFLLGMAFLTALLAVDFPSAAFLLKALLDLAAFAK